MNELTMNDSGGSGRTTSTAISTAGGHHVADALTPAAQQCPGALCYTAPEWNGGAC